MTYVSQASKFRYAGNGVATSFPTGFPFAKNSHVYCVLATLNASGGYDEQTLVEGQDYTLSGAGSDSGGTVVFPVTGSAHSILASGQLLTVYLKPGIAQEVDLSNSGGFDLEVHEAAFDLLTMICQSLQEQVDRAVLYPVSTPAEAVLDSKEFLDETTANKTAAQAAQAAAEAAQDASESAQGAAETAQGLSESARDSSQAHAGTATTQAGLASGYAATASSHATTASGHAATATTQAGIATTQAGLASGHATTAAADADDAETARAAAVAAQIAAEAALASTLAAYDSFDDRYLGAKASDPTTDNDGNALVAGMLYYNSVSAGMKVYTGSAWVAAYVSGSGYLASANNLSDLQNVDMACTNLGLVPGTAAGQIVQLDASAKLPAVDGSQLTGIGDVVRAYTKQQYAQLNALGAVTALTPDARTHQDCSVVNPASAVTIGNPTNDAPAMYITLQLKAASALSITWGSAYLAEANNPLPTAFVANKWMVLTFRCLEVGSWLYMGKAVQG